MSFLMLRACQNYLTLVSTDPPTTLPRGLISALRIPVSNVLYIYMYIVHYIVVHVASLFVASLFLPSHLSLKDVHILNVYVYICVLACQHVHTHTCAHTHVHTHTCTHTHVHTRTQQALFEPTAITSCMTVFD